MFNLIVSGQIENERKGKISASRVLQYTEEDVVARFMPDNKLDINAVMDIPTILMEEGKRDEPVYIAKLTKVKNYGSYYSLFYSIYPEIPSYKNSDFFALREELEIDDWEFGTNHWSIKDVDLFQVLLSKMVDQKPKPTVFQLSEKPLNSSLISLMMPFSADFDNVHKAIKNEVETNGYECRRADNFWENHHIMQDILELIDTSRVVICDLTGKNPNVFYEAGIAHTLGKEVILITQSDDDVPFDLKPIRYIKYLNNQEGLEKLANELLERVLKVT